MQIQKGGAETPSLHGQLGIDNLLPSHVHEAGPWTTAVVQQIHHKRLAAELVHPLRDLVCRAEPQAKTSEELGGGGENVWTTWMVHENTDALRIGAYMN